MSNSTLIQKIKADTEQAVAAIKEQQAVDVAAVAKETETTLAKLKTAHEIELKKAKEHLALVTTSRAKQSANIAVQRAKREAIDEVFATVKNEIVGLKEDEYISFFAQKVVDVVPEKAEIKTIEAPVDRVEETKSIVKKTGFSGDITSNKALKAGLVLHSDDGVYDITLDRIFTDKQADLEMLIAEKSK